MHPVMTAGKKQPESHSEGNEPEVGSVRKEHLLLCDYLLSDAAMLAEKEAWFDMRKKENLKLVRQYACLAIEERWPGRWILKAVRRVREI